MKKPILACGADLKGAFALAAGRDAFLVYDLGDLGELGNFKRYSAEVDLYRKKFGIKPQVIACDLHPDYFSTHFAESLQLKTKGTRLCRIQHHEAHIASSIADNDIKADVIGVAFDGTGYGTDGNIWGGEFFAGSLKGFTRAAHLEYYPMPGADMAVRQPWRMAVSYLYGAFGPKFMTIVKKRNRADASVIKKMIDKNINSPLTSSAGRLFDGAASLILAKDRVTREAELPIELEKTIRTGCRDKYDFDIGKERKELIIKTSPLIKGVVKDLAKKTDKAVIACKFHNTIADIIVKISAGLSKRFKTKKVVLSGGVFQNKYLTARAVEGLRAKGLEVYPPRSVPVNDIGIPIGQIAIANTRALCV
ncbi:MAG: hypothetical protein PHI58_01170 [Candidatus Omnitrophica bacterium]|nr:hypothetical protein [Candidatus Omnitrophota bacterium]